MCQQRKHTWYNHLLGRCGEEAHKTKVAELQKKIVTTRQMTNKELKEFNERLNVIIKDENISITLQNIKRISRNGNR